MNIELPLDGPARDRLRPASKALFQSRYALEAMLAIGGRDRFYQAEIADLAGCKPSYTGELLSRLEKAGLIEPLPAEPGQVRRYYRPLAAPLWAFCEAWAEQLRAGGGPQRPRGA